MYGIWMKTRQYDFFITLSTAKVELAKLELIIRLFSPFSQFSLHFLIVGFRDGVEV